MWKFSQPRNSFTLPSDPMQMLGQEHPIGSGDKQPPSARLSRDEGELIKQSDLIDFAINTWRLEQRAESLDPEKFKRQRRQFEDSALRFKNFLSRCEISFSDPKGRAFDHGMLDVEVISWDEPDEVEIPKNISGPWIHKTVSPIIYQGDQIIRRGEVICIDPES